AQPQTQAVVARWNDIMNSSARAIDASTYSGPSTSRRIGIPFSNSASSSAIFLPSCNPGAGIASRASPGAAHILCQHVANRIEVEPVRRDQIGAVGDHRVD